MRKGDDGASCRLEYEVYPKKGLSKPKRCHLDAATKTYLLELAHNDMFWKIQLIEAGCRTEAILKMMDFIISSLIAPAPSIQPLILLPILLFLILCSTTDPPSSPSISYPLYASLSFFSVHSSSSIRALAIVWIPPFLRVL